MPDQPLYQEFGKPMADGTKTSDEIFDAKYGKYKETGVWNKDGSKENPSSAMNPQPFGSMKK